MTGTIEIVGGDTGKDTSYIAQKLAESINTKFGDPGFCKANGSSVVLPWPIRNLSIDAKNTSADLAGMTASSLSP